MSWRQSSGRDVCNRCRTVADLGRPVYVGPMTGAFYCESCADSVLGQRLDGQPVPRVIAHGMDTFDARAMGEDLRRRILAKRRGEPTPADARGWE
jgi:hypothetical protein